MPWFRVKADGVFRWEHHFEAEDHNAAQEYAKGEVKEAMSGMEYFLDKIEAEEVPAP